jgi:guanylate kinase
VISGPSGVGKDSVLDELERRGHVFHRVITATTRAARPGEREGVEYHFVSADEFDRLVDTDGFLEHAVVYGHRYGVPRQQVLDALAAGQDVAVRTDVQGAATIRTAMPDAVLVFIAPGSMADLETRLRARAADSEEKIQRRLATASAEMARQKEFEDVVVNAPGQLAAAVDAVEAILARQRGRGC